MGRSPERSQPAEGDIQSNDPLQHPTTPVLQVRRERFQHLRNHPIVRGFQIRGLKDELLPGVERGLLLVSNLPGVRIHPHHHADQAQLNLVLGSLPEKPDHDVPGEI